jgi:hypothetical protein
MDPIAVIAIIGLVPVAILTLFRANAATAFLALCLGSILGTYVAIDTVNLLRGYVSPDSRLTESAISLILLWLPVLLVAIFMSRTISSKQRIINLLPALAVGLLGVLLTVPFLTPAVRTQIMASDAWNQIQTYQAAIVAAGTVVSFVLLRMRKKEEGKHGKHH